MLALVRAFRVGGIDRFAGPLFTSERISGLGHFSPDDARRWGVPAAPEISETQDGWLIERPWLRRVGDSMVVALVEERITRSCVWTFTVKQTLEDASGARRFWPVWM